jgi:hypothetical protein
VIATGRGIIRGLAHHPDVLDSLVRVATEDEPTARFRDIGNSSVGAPLEDEDEDQLDNWRR